jgi:hypothetical protein
VARGPCRKDRKIPESPEPFYALCIRAIVSKVMNKTEVAGRG